MSDQDATGNAEWPTHCPVCGTELQTHTTGFTPSETAESPGQPVSAAIVAEDYCPNPNCPAKQEA